MPYQFKTLTYWVIITNCFVCIGAGHGAGPIVIFETMIIPMSLSDGHFKFCLNFGCSYEDSLMAVSILFLIGQLTLLIATIFKSNSLRIASLIIMVVNMALLCRGLDAFAVLAFVTGAPFILLYLLLIVRLVQQYRAEPNVTD